MSIDAESDPDNKNHENKFDKHDDRGGRFAPVVQLLSPYRQKGLYRDGLPKE
jgi:hypothetical protein